MTDKDTSIDVDQMLPLRDIDDIAATCDSDALNKWMGNDDPLMRLIDTARLAHYLADLLEVKRTYYTNRDQRMKSVLEGVAAGSIAGHRLRDIAAEALHSHPVDSDAQKFVERIKAEVLRDFGSWCREHQGSEVFPYGADAQKGIDLFAAEHGIKIESE